MRLCYSGPSRAREWQEAFEQRFGLSSSDETSIRLLGHDLAGDLLGQVGFAELAYWLVAMRRPTAGELRVFEAVLVALADHGFTPSAIAARLTLTGAPESVQGRWPRACSAAVPGSSG